MSSRLSTFTITFAVAYAIIYIFAVEQNWALFTYHPATGTFGTLTTRAPAGPTMFWYGWILTAALGAAAVAAIVSFAPEGITRRIWPGLAWMAPMCAIVAFVYILRGYFFR
jgi:hypothetical protein